MTSDVDHIFFGWLGLGHAGAIGDVMKEDAEAAEQSEGSDHRFEEPLPPGVAPRDRRIFREIAVALGVGGVVENVDDVGSADGLGIVDAGVLPAAIIAELLGALFGDESHVFFAAEFQAAGGTCFDAGGFESFAYAIGAEGASVDAPGRGIG